MEGIRFKIRKGFPRFDAAGCVGHGGSGLPQSTGKIAAKSYPGGVPAFMPNRS